MKKNIYSVKKRNSQDTMLENNISKRLVISYCFPPFVDTAGTVMAKRIRGEKKKVDVLYNRMDRVRNRDEQLNLLVNDLINNRFEIPSFSTFSNWKGINDFCSLGMTKIENLKYEEIYSRAMWPASNFLAFMYKMKYQNAKWIAEFSDPILYDIHGMKRESNISKSFVKNANKFIRMKNQKFEMDENNLFFWCEYLVYLFADQIVFTNKNQYDYMMEMFPVKGMENIVGSKAIISPHPTLGNEYYYIEDFNYELDESKVNIAYFGTFYATRTLNEIILGLKKIDESYKKRINVHIFTSNPQKIKTELKSYDLQDYFTVNSYVNYFNFLNLTTKFDCLIVNDAKTKEVHSINPYLPSKLSDYLGSGSKIWGIYEEGSILSEYNLDYKTELENSDEAIQVIKKLVNNKFNK